MLTNVDIVMKDHFCKNPSLLDRVDPAQEKTHALTIDLIVDIKDKGTTPIK